MYEILAPLEFESPCAFCSHTDGEHEIGDGPCRAGRCPCDGFALADAAADCQGGAG